MNTGPKIETFSWLDQLQITEQGDVVAATGRTKLGELVLLHRNLPTRHPLKSKSTRVG